MKRGTPIIAIRVPARPLEVTSDDPIRKWVTPLHQTYAEAGNADGRYLTQFQMVGLQIKALVETEPGLDVATVAARLPQTPYWDNVKVARKKIARWLGDELIEGVRGERDGTRYRLYIDLVPRQVRRARRLGIGADAE